jgi:tetratricopeptide (TPR) repeat protein
VAQQAANPATVHGHVIDSAGKPVPGAVVRLTADQQLLETRTDASGNFVLQANRIGKYRLSAEKQGLYAKASAIDVSQASTPAVNLVLDCAGTDHGIEFADEPNFTVAGVTDWTAVGGHGSDAILRTSEDLSRESAALKAEGLAGKARPDPGAEAQLSAALVAAPQSYAANHDLGEFYLHAGNYSQAIPLLRAAATINGLKAVDKYDLALACRGLGDLTHARQYIQRALAEKDVAQFHRLAGEIDEQSGDPLGAVQEEERAVRLDPSEENYFAWGSELLLHRAIWQAAEVFKNGAKAYPNSVRMLTAWGAALFAGALYDQAAERLCSASDLDPAKPEIYQMMGKIELAAPAPLPCVDKRLARFVKAQPDNATANYLYAMTLLKDQSKPDAQAIEGLLIKAVSLDSKCADAYLQLGIIVSAQRHYPEAITYFTKALEADPGLAEAHYRLGVTLDRTGDHEKAVREFRLHDELEQAQAKEIEQQRREVKQFLVVPQGESRD